MATNRHPLPESQLPRVRVSDDTVELWKSEAQDAMDQLLHDPASWFYCFDSHVQQGGFKSLRNRPELRGGSRAQTPGSCVVEFLSQRRWDQLSLEDVVLGLHCESTFDQRAVFAKLYEGICLDGAILELFHGASQEDPFFSVATVWLALTTPVRSILSYRDYLYFQYRCTMQDAMGRRVLVDYKKTIDLGPDALLQDHALNTIRGRVAMISTYHVDDDGQVVNTVRGSRDPGGTLPSWLAINYLPLLLGHCVNMLGLSQSRALLHAGIRASSLSERRVDVPASAECRVCSRKHSTFARRKNWCRACGYTVCRSCTNELILPADGVQIASSLPFVRTRFCHCCVAYAQGQHFKRRSSATARIENRSLRLMTRSPTWFDSFFGCMPDSGMSPFDETMTTMASVDDHALFGLSVEEDNGRDSVDIDVTDGQPLIVQQTTDTFSSKFSAKALRARFSSGAYHIV